jgi:hypothetical protein
MGVTFISTKAFSVVMIIWLTDLNPWCSRVDITGDSVCHPYLIRHHHQPRSLANQHSPKTGANAQCFAQVLIKLTIPKEESTEKSVREIVEEIIDKLSEQNRAVRIAGADISNQNLPVKEFYLKRVASVVGILDNHPEMKSFFIKP